MCKIPNFIKGYANRFIKRPGKSAKNTDHFNLLGVSDDLIEIELKLNEAFLNLCDTFIDQPIGTVHVVHADKSYFEDTEATACNQRIKFSSNILPSRALELEPFLQIKDRQSGQANKIATRFTGLTLHGHAIIAIDNANFKVKDSETQLQIMLLMKCQYQVPTISPIFTTTTMSWLHPSGTQSRLFR
ncbi:unnamed protein product [Mytilus edulis]|uniref:Uncharacterized protein n=1 Tax=Mytilus edulis TaxID=6550 RepID=A0A8S3R3D6_MYTED|nr:unnamed protein product [Mytilus edulis]